MLVLCYWPGKHTSIKSTTVLTLLQLIGITAAMNNYVPPGPDDVYSQGFWHAIIAASVYLFSSMMLMVNMLGYFLGHYPQHFALTDDQRNLILQTIMFFIWLAGGGAVFARVTGWPFTDALYFCDVTILTIGFGDYFPPNNAARGLVFPYSVFGIIILGLMVSSIHSFANELGQDKVIKHHIERRRVLTMDRTVTSSTELERREREDLEKSLAHKRHITISAPLAMRKSTTIGPSPPPPPRASALTFDEPNSPDKNKNDEYDKETHRKSSMHAFGRGLKRAATFNTFNKPPQQKKSKLLLMREEKDRFDAMRKIQKNTTKFKHWYELSLSITAFGILWCVGAVGFFYAEQSTQGLSYFETLYFCYVSLLTIGYGDFSPKSNAGKPYFILWSLIAIPTMTILISDMGDTIISSFKQGTFVIADWTVLPKKGLYRSFLDRNPWLWNWIQRKAEEKRVKRGFAVGFPENENALPTPTLEELATEDTNHPVNDQDRAKRLSMAIRKTANDLHLGHDKQYSYEEWVEFTRLVRFTALTDQEIEDTEDVEGIVKWDWIGDNSPMLADLSEPEWVLDRLCESLNRYLRSDPRDLALQAERRKSQIEPTGADVGDEAPLIGTRPNEDPDYLNKSQGKSPGLSPGSRPMDFRRASWDPMRTPEPSPGLNPTWMGRRPSPSPQLSGERSRSSNRVNALRSEESRVRSARSVSSKRLGSRRVSSDVPGDVEKEADELGMTLDMDSTGIKEAGGVEIGEGLQNLDGEGAGVARRRSRQLSEAEIDALSGPERRRYRRFSAGKPTPGGLMKYLI
jgi:potassium channel subfamily K, other eukaryote